MNVEVDEWEALQVDEQMAIQVDEWTALQYAPRQVNYGHVGFQSSQSGTSLSLLRFGSATQLEVIEPVLRQ